MKKCFLLLCLLTSMSQICSANIIIDLDIKLTYSIPNSIGYQCSPSGCIFGWGEGDAQYWMTISNPLGQYTAFKIITYSYQDEHLILVKEAPNGIPETEIVLPGGDCDEYGFTHSGLLWLRPCGQLPIAGIQFSDMGDYLNVRLVGNEADLTLSRYDPIPPNQTMVTEGGPIEWSSHEGNTADRGTAATQKYAAASISPNPFSQSLKVQSNASETETINLQLLNSNGQTLQTVSYKGGQEAYEFFTADVPPGFYFLQVKVADSVRSYRVVKIE